MSDEHAEQRESPTTVQNIIELERERALAEIHAALDLLHEEREKRARAEARLREIELSRAWRLWTRVRRALGRDRTSPDGG